MLKGIKKIFILGIDGATFDLILPWVNQGKLPNLAKLINKSAYGELESTIPPVTAPAWTSFFTGKNPGKHGMYDFIVPNEESKALSYLSYEDCESETIWSILSEKGKKVCVINIPMTYPPEAVNGVFISGMAPGLDSEFAYPPNLKKEIKRKFPNYIIFTRPDKEPARFLKSIKEMTRIRAKLAKHFLTSRDWDVFMVVFNSTDIVQHRFWRYMEKYGHRNKYSNAILDVYRLVDKEIGDLWKCLDEDTLFLIMSDHGAGPWDKHVHLNKWLEKNGYLKFKNSDEDIWLRKIAKKVLVNSFVFWNNRIPSHIQDKIKRSIPIKNLNAFEKVESVMNAQFDWSQTKAYHIGTYANIRINLKEREAEGIVEPGEEYEMLREEIIKKLLKLDDPETGKKPINRVFKREEIYHGATLDKAPDLLIKWAKENYWSCARFGSKGEEVFESLKDELNPLITTGTHKLNGILMAYGGMINPQKINNARIIDLAPTILYGLGLPIPEDMDGEPLLNLFTNKFKKDKKIEYEKREFLHKKKKKVFSHEDEKDINERLKGLGYI